MKKLVVALAVVSLLFLATPAQAAKPLPAPRGSESIVYEGDLTYLSQLTVTISGFRVYENGYGPWIGLQCGRPADPVNYSEVRAGFPGGYGYGVPFHIGPSLAYDQDYPDETCTVLVWHANPNTGLDRIDAAVSFDVQ